MTIVRRLDRSQQMRRTISFKSLALAYGLALVWIVAMVGGAVVLTAPMLDLYLLLGVESVFVHSMVTLALALAAATLVTLAVALVVRAVSAHVPAGRQAEAVPGMASHQA
jgi:hypothetical protein